MNALDFSITCDTSGIFYKLKNVAFRKTNLKVDAFECLQLLLEIEVGATFIS